MSYHSPTALTDALEILSQGSGTVVAGGTDLYPAAKRGQEPDCYVDITGIKSLRDIRIGSEAVFVGAGVTWSHLVKTDLPSAFDALKQAAIEVGSVQIQNAGTIVGNICNASPAADGVPALLALDAAVEISSAERGARSVPLSRFITGVRQKDLAADEIVSGITIPIPPAEMRSAFEKLGSRRYLVISICMTAANLLLDKAGLVLDARIAVGACSAVAKRLHTLEQDLIGQSPVGVIVSARHLTELAPIDDVRGTAVYRNDVVCEQLRRAIERAATL